MALLKPFRALRYDPEVAGPLDDLVAPPYDVITPELRQRLEAASPANVVRLIRPHEHEEAARDFHDWLERGVLVREGRPAVWQVEEDFVGPDGVARTRRGLAGRLRLEPYSTGIVLPHERTFPAAKEARLQLLRAVRTKLSPVFLLHDGEGPGEPPAHPPDLESGLDGTRTRLWRVDEPEQIVAAVAHVEPRLIIADGHHRYESALRYHEERGDEESGFVLAVVISRHDPGLVIYPTHRLVANGVPNLNGRFRVTPLSGGAEEGLDRLAELPRDHPAFVLLRRDEAVLAEGELLGSGPLATLDTTAVDSLALEGLSFTASAEQAKRAVAAGQAEAALLVRAPTVEQVVAVALAGELMPQKSTYFFPKLLSGLLFAPFDE